MRYCFHFIIIFAFTLCTYHQGVARNDSISNAYVKKFSDQFYVKLITTSKFLNLSFEDSQSDAPKMQYSPYLGNYLGIGIYAFDLGIDVSFRLKNQAETENTYGKTTGIDWRVNMVSRWFGVDARFQNIKGFYMKNPGDYYPDWESGDPYPQRPDMKIKSLHLGFTYIFSPELYSMPAAFNHSQQQLKPKGSFLLSGIVNNTELSGDSSFIPHTDSNAFSNNTGLRDLSILTIGVMPGYAHTFGWEKGFYISLSLALGPAFQRRSYVSNDGSDGNNRLSLASNWRIGMGINNEVFFTGVTFYLQQNDATFENIRMNTQSGFVRFFIGFRFPEKGIMKKSIFGLLPFLESKY